MGEGFGDLNTTMEKGFGDLEKGFGDLEKGFGDLEKGFGDLNSTMEKGFGDLNTTMEKGFGDIKAELKSMVWQLRILLGGASLVRIIYLFTNRLANSYTLGCGVCP